MRRKRKRIIYQLCKGGCGTMLAGVARPIVNTPGGKLLFDKYSGYCEGCITEPEKDNLNHDMLRVIQGS